MKKIFITSFLTILLSMTLLFTACDPSELLNANLNDKEYITQITNTQTDKLDSKETEIKEKIEIVEPTYNVDFYKIYESAKSSGEFSGTYLEFIKEYFGVNASPSMSTEYATNLGLLSSVSIHCGFTKIVTTYSSRGLPTGSYEYDYATAGSGVIYEIDKTTGNAYIITNFHVVYDIDSKTTNKISQDISVFLYGGEYAEYEISATYIGGSMNYDIAILQITESPIIMSSFARSIDFANSNEICVGSSAIAIGNPEAQGISATQGIVSVESEYISITAPDNTTPVSYRVMRIDTAINSGNSGGGLFNNSGELIGIVNAKVSDTSIENIGYAIPSNVVRYVTENIIYNYINSGSECVKKCLLGIGLQVKTSKAIYDINTKKTNIVETIVIQTVSEDSIINDLVKIGMTINSITINDKVLITDRLFKLVDIMLTVRVGDKIKLNVTDLDEETYTLEFEMTAESITEIL